MPETRASADRLGIFSDAVIAVIITIMVLELKPPDGPHLADLLPLWPTAISYLASYLFIAIIWVNHHHLMQFVHHPTSRLIWLNFVHLFFVSLIPFATAWVARSEMAAVPVALYATVFLLVDVAYLVFEREVLTAADQEVVPDRVRRRAQRRTLLAVVVFATGAVVAPFVPLLGFGIVCVALLLYLSPEALHKHSQEPVH